MFTALGRLRTLVLMVTNKVWPHLDQEQHWGNVLSVLLFWFSARSPCRASKTIGNKCNTAQNGARDPDLICTQHDGMRRKPQVFLNQTVTVTVISKFSFTDGNQRASWHSVMRRRKDLKDNTIYNHSKPLTCKSNTYTFMSPNVTALKREVKKSIRQRRYTEFLEDTFTIKMSDLFHCATPLCESY